MRVLIVEDDMVIAGILGPVVVRSGHKLVGLAADHDSATALLRSVPVDFAFVDIHLLDGWTGVDVARAAVAEGATTAFTTANPGLVPSDFAGACGVIEKPYTEAQIEATLAFVSAKLRGKGYDLPPPRGFAVSPFWMPPSQLATPRTRAPIETDAHA